MVVALGTLPSRTAAATRCTIDNSSGVRFGPYRASRQDPLDSVGFIVYSCDGVQAADVVTIQLGRSLNGSFLPRAMVGPSRNFEYNLYVDAARTVVWGDGTSGTTAYRGRPPEHRSVSVPVYARIPPRQPVPIGHYADMIVVTLLF